ncbi:MAG: translation initiation factor IF-6 [Candidatus Aenigmarchaeota archaeon]|nr:translation initiation factor IF-6 [Candidatus Aenigmarchaeota archaeon]
MSEHIAQLNFNGDPNIGLFAVPTDDFCVVGNIMKKDEEKIRKILGTDVVRASVAGSELVGIFSAANKNGVVLPRITREKEMEAFKELGINVFVPKTKQTAFGNLILLNDNGCIIPDELKGIKKGLEDCFGVPVEISSVAGLSIVGSSSVATNKGLLVHRNCTEEELKKIEQVLKVKGDIGTVSFGSPFVGAGVIANSRGFLVSEETTGPELQRIDEALGFLG